MLHPNPAAIVIVANPVAGGYNHRRLMRLADRLDRRGHRSDIHLTRYAGDLAEIAATLPPQVKTLVVGGGDGSINEAITGLIRRKGELPALAVLPFGTANVLACELGLPFAPEKLADHIADGTRRPLHLGMIGTRPFALMVSAGFDADVVHAVDGKAKKRWGKLAYVGATICRLARGDGGDVVVEADGARIIARVAVVTTASCYGGPYRLSRHTRADEPGLRLITLADDRPLSLLRALAGLALGRLDRIDGVIDRPVERARFSGAGIRMQIDGDAMEATDAEIRAGRVIAVVG